MDSRTLAAILPRAPATASGAVTDAMAAWSVNTPRRQAAFLAQVGHESSDLTRLVESLNYSQTALRATFPKRITADQALALGRRAGEVSVPEDRQRRIAEAAYGGRADLGNTEDGDGWRFRGRGAIQLTGRANYRRAGDALGLSLEDQPELLGQLPAAVQSAAWFWASNGLNELADKDSLLAFEDITRRINGGINGWEDRLARYRAACKVLGC
jgi:putative chitinase